jgi:hypothetical protein
MFCLRVVCDVYFCVVCLIVVPMPPGKNQFAVQLNNNNNISLILLSPMYSVQRKYKLSDTRHDFSYVILYWKKGSLRPPCLHHSDTGRPCIRHTQALSSPPFFELSDLSFIHLHVLWHPLPSSLHLSSSFLIRSQNLCPEGHRTTGRLLSVDSLAFNIHSLVRT